MATLITERFAFSGGKVDRSGPRPIVRGVLLCGATSANRRRYRKEAFAGDRIRKYEGRPVFLNHGDGRAPRRYEDRIAKVINARRRGDGMPIGDLELRPKHPYAETFLDDAEHDPNSLGMSHVAHAESSRAADGWEDVNSIESVESVDIVIDPATTKGLYESTRRQPGATAMRQTIRQMCGKVVKHRRASEGTKRIARVLLREAEELDMADDAAVDDADAADDDSAADDEVKGAVTSGIKAAIDSIIDKCLAGDMDWAKGKEKVDKLFDAHASATEESRRRPGGKIPTFENMGSGGIKIPRFDTL